MASRLPLTQRLAGRAKRPQELLAYSEVGKEQFFDDRALTYYYLPRTELERNTINIGTGYEMSAFDPASSIASHIDHVLSAIMEHEKRNNGEKIDASIITWRGLLTQLIVASQGQLDRTIRDQEIDFNVVGFDDQVFIENDLDSARRKAELERSKLPPDARKAMYAGFQFEHVATLPKPWGECTRDEIEERYKTPTTWDSYAILVKSGIGNVKAAYVGETDCVQGGKDPADPLANYVELKSTRILPEGGRDLRAAAGFERKLLKTWVQSFLSGVPKVVYGFRDNQLNLVAIEEYKTTQLPVLVKNSIATPPNRRWNGNDVMGFYAILMQWLKDKVENGKTYKLTYTPGSDSLLLKETTLKTDGREVAFLTNEFVQWRRSRSQQAQS